MYFIDNFALLDGTGICWKCLRKLHRFYFIWWNF